MQFAGLSYFGRIATWLATWFTPPYRNALAARYNSKAISRPVQLSIILICNSALMFSSAIALLSFRLKRRSSGLAERVRHIDICIETGDGGQWELIHPFNRVAVYTRHQFRLAVMYKLRPPAPSTPSGIAPGELIMKQPLQKEAS